MAARLISHSPSQQSLETAISELRRKIEAAGDQAHVTVAKQLELLEELATFELGRFLIINKGINGFWTNYIVMYPLSQKDAHASKAMSPLERFLLEQCPIVKATQERFQIFLRLAQEVVHNEAVLASIPCGLMSDLLLLNYDSIESISIVGIDLDAQSILHAQNLAADLGLAKWTQYYQRDAWDLQFTNEFSLIVSNGLNIYENDEIKLLNLYQTFYNALKPDGVLITSFLTPSPWMSQVSEWDLSKIDQQALQAQRIVYLDLLEFKAQSYTTSERIKQQLKEVGFKQIEIVYDSARMFPTVRAYR